MHTHIYGLYYQLAAGQVLSFNVGLHDDDDGGDWDSYLIWQGDSTTDDQRFGALWLMAQ